ncbi:hypothetical protein VT84_36745 [Gemmata sp. SH-PL17]|uniref:hypothetical protein n=1 Tax=Gemmata sp. SH-PL17 TaxID=1630693 RepID=UPI00078EEF2A|nr:hypothetical protein [Gemmata sp. SH-PL17]AMV30000.1 hypothetical protein VT84_36745 [Gemmata sp. SH-PL17]
MKLGILSLAAALALVVSGSSASAQPPVELVSPPPAVVVSPPPVLVSPAPVIVAAPPVVVARPVIVAPAYPAVTVVRPGFGVTIGNVYPAYGYYGRPYYGHYHHHR